MFYKYLAGLFAIIPTVMLVLNLPGIEMVEAISGRKIPLSESSGYNFFHKIGSADPNSALSSQTESHAIPLQFLIASYSDRENIQLCEEGIELTIRKLPYSDSLNTIILSFQAEGPRGLADAHTIILRCDTPKFERMAVLLHEMGHIAYFNSSEEIQREFRDLSDRSGDGDFVSGYSRENALEDFAESFLAYVEFGESFRNFPSKILQEKYEFLKKDFFENQEFDGSRSDFGNVFDLSKLSPS